MLDGEQPGPSTLAPRRNKLPSVTPPSADRTPRRDTVTAAMLAFGRAWNAYEVRGAEVIPLDRPALIVWYHGLIPLDAFYFGSWFYQRHGKMVRALAERLVFEIPGLRELALDMGAVPGTRDAALELLGQGHLVAVSPGGVREAIAGRAKSYQLVWGERLGFAKVALQAGVDIIPAFAENIDEAWRSPGVHHPRVQAFYERTRIPVVPIVGAGLLPLSVKLRSWVGEPIRALPGESPESLRARTASAIEALIRLHQGPRPRLPRALLQRLSEPDWTP